MVKRLIWSERARDDRKEIIEYWIKTTGSVKYSLKLKKDFNSIISLLLFYPELGLKIKDYDARCLVKGDYKMFYDVKSTEQELEIQILHIWDTRRNPEDLEV